MLHNPQENRLFPTLPAAALQVLESHGELVCLAPGEILFSEGDPIEHFFVVLEGTIRITKTIAGQEQLLTIHEVGEFTGDITMLTKSPASATGQAYGSSRVLKVAATVLGHLVVSGSPWVAIILTAMAGRTQEVGSHLQQQEKLAALGTLSAGLAHELNNPAAAGRRAAQQLRAVLTTHHEATLALCRLEMAETQRQTLLALAHSLNSAEKPQLLDPLSRSDREEAIMDWLADHHVPEGWAVAPTLVSAGLEVTHLQTLAGQLNPESLPQALHWLQVNLDTAELVTQVEHSTERISALVSALKSYTYRDQAPLQEIDIHEGIDDTLTILHHKLQSGIVVIRDYGTLPRICAFGSELNQVWTHLFENALDAMQGQGTLTIRTRDIHTMVQVEILDTGSGIPTDIQSRIFEPFFTTKGIGQGTGLGLDSVRRIISNRHGGSIRVDSEPGNTRFLLTIPLHPPKEKN